MKSPLLHKKVEPEKGPFLADVFSHVDHVLFFPRQTFSMYDTLFFGGVVRREIISVAFLTQELCDVCCVVLRERHVFFFCPTVSGIEIFFFVV